LLRRHSSFPDPISARIVDVADPTSTYQIGIGGGATSVRDVAVDQDYAYLL
jgi:hypothetical protein